MSSERIEKLAKPRKQSMYFLPDRPSVYWLDYIPDPTPHLITDPTELLQYYQEHWFTNPRIEQLAQSRPLSDFSEPRPSTQYGISLSALNYVPSERIRILAQPSERGDTSTDHSSKSGTEGSRSRVKFPSIDNGRAKIDPHDTWDWSRLPRTTMQRTMGSRKTPNTTTSQSSIDAMSKGDFRSRSRVRKGRQIVPSRIGNEQKRNPIRLPPLQHGQGEIKTSAKPHTQPVKNDENGNGNNHLVFRTKFR